MAIQQPIITDMELIQRVANFDSKALESLYNRYSPILYTLIKKIVNDEKVADEILIDVFVIIWRKISYFDVKTGNVYAWLITLARNKAVDSKRRSRDPQLANIPYDDLYENNVIIPRLSPSIDALDLKTVTTISDKTEDALNKLTDAQQYVIFLAYYEGLTENEISKKLNIPIQTVKSKIKIALASLKDNLIKGGA